jgi:hypothetical protein
MDSSGKLLVLSAFFAEFSHICAGQPCSIRPDTAESGSNPTGNSYNDNKNNNIRR